MLKAKLEIVAYVLTAEEEEMLFRVAVACIIQGFMQRPKVAETMRKEEYEAEQHLEIVYVKRHNAE
jgi:hypothetical protein